MMRFLIGMFLLLLSVFLSPVFAAADARENANNSVGIGLLSPESEIEEASKMVNNNGDWGWAVIVINKDERNVERWQGVMNLMTKNHMIPIVRLATRSTKDGYWEKPTEDDAVSWADFLSSLYWPTKNKYVQVYNEVNSGNEWGGKADATSYAIELARTSDALKSKDNNFFVLNSPLDLAIKTSESSISADQYFLLMKLSVVGIFDILDGWASHSYPNPDFSASPTKEGRLGISGYKWELSQISKYTTKSFGVFITETGWKRADGGLNETKISEYYNIAFESVWNNPQIVMVAPFVFSYPDPLYYQFAFKKTGEEQNSYFTYFDTIKKLTKIIGVPERENKAFIQESLIPDNILKDTTRVIKIKIINSGNIIWNSEKDLKIIIFGSDLSVKEVSWDKPEIYPGDEATAKIMTWTGEEGEKKFSIKLYSDKSILWEGNFHTNSVSLLSYVVESLKKNIAIPFFTPSLAANP